MVYTVWVKKVAPLVVTFCDSFTLTEIFLVIAHTYSYIYGPILVHLPEYVYKLYHFHQ